MEYHRAGPPARTGGGVAPSSVMMYPSAAAVNHSSSYSVAGGASLQPLRNMGYEEDDDGFEFEQTAFAALKEFEPVEGQWEHPGGQFDLPPAFDAARQPSLNNNSESRQSHQQKYVGRPIHSSAPSQQPPPQQQQRQGHPSSGAAKSHSSNHQSGTRSQGSWGVSLPAAAIERNDYREAAKFFLESKSGNEAAALDFLRGVFLVLTNPNLGATDPISTETHDWDMAVRNGPPYLTPEDQAAAQAQLVMNQHNSILLQAQRLGVPPRPPAIIPVTLLGDEIDQRLATLVILVPGRAHIVGHLIGKGGAEVGRIEREMSVTIKIEAASKMNVQLLERSVCIIGTVAATTLAQQFVSHKVHEKLLSEGVQAEVLKMIVPNEIVRHLIGKNGANINRLQNESGARIQVEPESTMAQGSVGRTIVLQGAERCRTFAQYLILRQIAEDRNVHSEWAGRMPQMHSVSGSGSPSGSPATAPNQVTSQMASNHPMQPLSASSTNPLLGKSMQHSHHDSPSYGTPVEESVMFSVPEQSVAYVIGRNGAAIADIQTQTGAKIHISRGNTNGVSNGGVGGEMRKVTITGPATAVEAAQHLIRQKLQATAGRGGPIAAHGTSQPMPMPSSLPMAPGANQYLRGHHVGMPYQ